MNITELEAMQKKYKSILFDLQKLKGEEESLMRDKESLIKKLNENGFSSTEDLKNKINVLENEIQEIVREIEIKA